MNNQITKASALNCHTVGPCYLEVLVDVLFGGAPAVKPPQVDGLQPMQPVIRVHHPLVLARRDADAETKNPH